MKTLEHYLAHPEDLPTDPAQLAQIEAMMADAGVADPAPPAPSEDPKVGDPAPADDPKPVLLAKDGKHTIPYSELESARDAAAKAAAEKVEAERRAAEIAERANAQIRELQEQLEAAKDGRRTADVEQVALTDEELEAMKTEAPMFYRMFQSQRSIIESLEKQIKDVTTAVVSDRTTRAADEAAEVQDLIDQVPDLKNWQEKAPYLFDRAQKIEAALLNDKSHPEYQTDDLARYKAVAAQVRQEIGLPAADGSIGSSTDKPGDLAAKADAAVGSLNAPVPRSLSDIKGGTAPAQTLHEELERLSGKELELRLLAMTPAQQEAWYARL